jgi:Leucine-rich repeat (LRR) protein
MGVGQFIKSLQDVNNPQYFISLRFSDRKINDLKGIYKFKNLSELDISGNLLTEEIPELK